MLRTSTSAGYSRNDLLAILRLAGPGALLGALVGFPLGEFAFAHPSPHPIEAAAILAILGACVGGALTRLRPLPVTFAVSTVVAGIAIAGGFAGATVTLWAMSAYALFTGQMPFFGLGFRLEIDLPFLGEYGNEAVVVAGALAGGWWLLRRVARWVARDVL